jgi:hypothetical protein
MPSPNIFMQKSHAIWIDVENKNIQTLMTKKIFDHEAHIYCNSETMTLLHRISIYLSGSKTIIKVYCTIFIFINSNVNTVEYIIM